jgi:hypothetical protein
MTIYYEGLIAIIHTVTDQLLAIFGATRVLAPYLEQAKREDGGAWNPSARGRCSARKKWHGSSRPWLTLSFLFLAKGKKRACVFS